MLQGLPCKCMTVIPIVNREILHNRPILLHYHTVFLYSAFQVQKTANPPITSPLADSYLTAHFPLHIIQLWPSSQPAVLKQFLLLWLLWLFILISWWLRLKMPCCAEKYQEILHLLCLSLAKLHWPTVIVGNVLLIWSWCNAEELWKWPLLCKQMLLLQTRTCKDLCKYCWFLFVFLCVSESMP